MLQHPNIDPVIVNIGPLALHWYGVMYLIGFLSAWFLAQHRNKNEKVLPDKVLTDLIFYGFIAAVLGGRIGYMLFYQTSELISNPLALFKVWQGGMSFHGGLIGAPLGVWIYSKRCKQSFFKLMDFGAPLVPIGLGAGRIGNFINAELWGRPTDLPWAFIFPKVDNLPRHPSQLYECLLEGIILFIILWVYSSKPRPTRYISAMFLILYGAMRFAIEFTREPDAHLNFIAFNWLTMGQLLSVPMIILGLILIYITKREQKT